MANKYKYFTEATLMELIKRVPREQARPMKRFLEKTLIYRKRFMSYPDKLPKLDWEFYRNNVRKNYVKMVDQYQIKYEELDQAFSGRHDGLDYTKYYSEVEALEEAVKDEVRLFKAQSEARIRQYEAEILRLKNMCPYDTMTLEQFVTIREDRANYIPRNQMPLYWPHDEEEQQPPELPKEAEEEEEESSDDSSSSESDDEDDLPPRK